MNFSNVVIFGGAGFIGMHLANFMRRENKSVHIYIVDIASFDRTRFAFFSDLFAADTIHYIKADVREKNLEASIPITSADLIINLAAVHREPGHQAHEYFETNLYGAENVCAWAETVGCNRVMFTSSIAPYGPTETEKTEQSLPVPLTPYGASKLAAEKIHISWQHKDIANRRLVIVRPGVVFGAGEGGNVTRLVRAVIKRYFAYMGNHRTRKAGGYIKELCHSLFWVLEQQDKGGEKIVLYNFTMPQPPSIEEYVTTTCKVAKIKRFIPSIPYFLLYIAAVIIEFFARPLKISHPFSPVRIRKLVRSNNIKPQTLNDMKYTFQYTLEQAFNDWKKENVKDWE